MKEITVIIKPDGATVIEAHEFQSAACDKATAFLEEALGVVTKKTRKPEYYKQAQATQRASR